MGSTSPNFHLRRESFNRNIYVFRSFHLRLKTAYTLFKLAGKITHIKETRMLEARTWTKNREHRLVSSCLALTLIYIYTYYMTLLCFAFCYN